MIYIIKKKGLYQNKVNFSLVSSCNFKMGYYAFWVKAKQTNLTIYIYNSYPDAPQEFNNTIY